MGETKNHMTRSAVTQLGCLLSPLLSVSFSSMTQPNFPHHGTSHKNGTKMPVCLMCGPRSSNWSSRTGGLLLLDPAAKGGEKTPDDGQRWYLGPGAELTSYSESCDVNFHLVSPNISLRAWKFLMQWYCHTWAGAQIPIAKQGAVLWRQGTFPNIQLLKSKSFILQNIPLIHYRFYNSL